MLGLSMSSLGVMDITTQVELENAFIGRNVTNNAVFRKAVEIFSKGTFNEYKHKWSPEDYNNRVAAPQVGK